MSGLTLSLRLYNQQQPQQKQEPASLDPLPPAPSPPLVPDDDSSSSSSSSPSSSGPVSPSSSYAVLPPLSISTCSSTPSTSSTRPNEHLAVLLPTSLWKPDSLAVYCDNFYCRCKFSMFERRHHCRKCGGVFCHSCSSRTIPLLDTANLPFQHPPRNTPISSYESAVSPIYVSRVCDDCWDQIHACPSSPDVSTTSSPSLMTKRRLRPMQSISSLTSQSSNHSTTTSPSTHTQQPHRSSRPASTSRTRRRISLRSSTQPPLPQDVLQQLALVSSPSSSPSPLDTSPPINPLTSPTYGELDAYPLKRHSAVCKVTGGGRWTPEPTPEPLLVDSPYGYIACKPREHQHLHQQSGNGRAGKDGIVDDGMFRYRKESSGEGVILEEGDVEVPLSSSPMPLSTF